MRTITGKPFQQSELRWFPEFHPLFAKMINDMFVPHLRVHLCVLVCVCAAVCQQKHGPNYMKLEYPRKNQINELSRNK